VKNSNDYVTDAKTFAEWGIDLIKVGACGEDQKNLDDLYPKLGKALNESGLYNNY
jgi:alpha-N-acetylgalactosaminidase